MSWGAWPEAATEKVTPSLLYVGLPEEAKELTAPWVKSTWMAMPRAVFAGHVAGAGRDQYGGISLWISLILVFYFMILARVTMVTYFGGEGCTTSTSALMLSLPAPLLLQRTNSLKRTSCDCARGLHLRKPD